MFGWLAASSFSITSIQAFWLVALAAADRIATSPASPICSAIMSTWTLAMPSAVAWLMNRSRHSGLVSESKVTTLAPASRASLSGVADRLRVVGRDDQRGDALLGGGVDERHLRVRAGLVGADLLVGAAELLDRRLAAVVAGVEVGVARGSWAGR